MKIRLNLPTLGEVFSHDAPLYKIIKIALPAFILISSLTVFAGVRSHISDYLGQYSLWITLPGYTFSYLLFSLSPDVLNAVLVAYFVRSMLKKKFQGTDIVLNLFALGLIIFLTKYSYNMSQFSAGSMSNEMGKEIEEIDLSKINAEYKLEKKEIQTTFNEDKAEVEKLYNEQITLLNQRYENQFIPLREKIKGYEKNRVTNNTSWTDKKIKEQKDKITSLEKDKLTEADHFLKEKQGKIALLQETRDSQITALGSDKKNDRNNAQSLKEKTNQEKAQANDFLKKEFEKIAGVAIFIVLVLASLKEIIHFRNDIDPQPIISELDFQFDWLMEILSYPFVFIQRHSVNRVREWYNNLPDLVEPPKEAEEITDYKASQKIVPLKVVSNSSAEEGDRTFFRQPEKAKISASFRQPFIADENHTKNKRNGAHETIEMREAKRRLKQYKKDLGRHQQKARVQAKKDGYISTRTQNAIDNNLSWVEHFTDILNGGSGTR
ncbi:MAG: hypothetical protein KDC85_23130 [Saprospiraceae bacterium]|nr:hypothetical protein [Saprospiraceae bacterium]MCB9322871.1 hypothetical protein [Lewinellaceae bacterium]